MVKNIIERIIDGNYTLSQALQRVKVIQLQKNLVVPWIDKEASGYEILDKELPEYRKIYAPVKITVTNGYDRKTIKVKVANEAHDELKKFYAYHMVFEPISIVEEHVRAMSKSVAFSPINDFVFKKIEDAYAEQLEKQDLVIESCYREIPKTALLNIIEQTKIKLISYLHELEHTYPDLNENVNMKDDSKNSEKNVNINNIYGGAGTMNIAAGVNVTQNVSNNLSIEEATKLLEYGVTSGELNELKSIIELKAKDKPTFTEKIGKWLSNVTASIISKGITENIPQIIEIVNRQLI